MFTHMKHKSMVLRDICPSDGRSSLRKWKESQSIKAPLVIFRAIPSEAGLDLAWRKEVVKASVRPLLSVAVTGREEGLTEIGISGILSPRWNLARWRLGRRSCLGSAESC